jgi:uncharacterized membrane protein YfcA
VLTVLGLGAAASLALVLAFLFAYSFGTGLAGALLGLGGGLFLVPMLILVFDLTPSLAIAASLVAVIATSSGAASTYVDQGLANLRLGMFLEVATVVGGLVGAFVTVDLLVHDQGLLVLAFVPAVVAPAVLMLARRRTDTVPDPPADAWADGLKLHGHYVDPRTGATVPYRVTGTRVGLVFAAIAGVVSGLLGIGGGLFYVPALNTFMNVPIRVAGATSNFMIGVTAASSAIVYLLGGQVALFWTAPVVLGMLLGSRFGSRVHRTISTGGLKFAFVGVLLLAAVLMALRGLGVIAG